MKNPAGYTKLFRVLNLKELGIIIKKKTLRTQPDKAIKFQKKFSVGECCKKRRTQEK